MYSEYYKVGFIARTFGIKGEVVLTLDADDESRYLSLKEIWLEQNGELKRYVIKSGRLKNKNLFIGLERIDVVEDAELLLKSSAYLPLTYLPELDEKSFYFHEVTGFAVIDSVHGSLGVLESIMEFPGQAVMQIKKGNKEILIPVKPQFIDKVDRSAKTLYINSPEGLVDIYLGDSPDKEEDFDA